MFCPFVKFFMQEYKNAFIGFLVHRRECGDCFSLHDTAAHPGFNFKREMKADQIVLMKFPSMQKSPACFYHIVLLLVKQ